MYHDCQVEASVAAHCPFLLLQVFDYDGPLAADDFLGQVEIDLLKQRLSVSHASMQTLPLAAKLAGVRQTSGLGHIRIAVWVQPTASLLPPRQLANGDGQDSKLQQSSTASQAGAILGVCMCLQARVPTNLLERSVSLRAPSLTHCANVHIRRCNQRDLLHSHGIWLVCLPG